ncbi:DUF87 domain-containing protein [Haloarcula hispanica]|uniref:DUF87 domain-containing protein n=2 Tax=Haloarcula TaxID=2237 RepID=A0A5J5LFH7_HALHI|nr:MULTISPECIES: DUF87 domain-containing protein [Haloarcula]EMA14479.1 Type IV secretory pathway VirB4 protein-like protein [Haloarcula amylolytica JCM 13557]KAA9404695.1 DUF87 domain-containing protein [Haloarcula hispanica]
MQHLIMFQTGGIASMTKSVYALFGFEWVVNTYGVWPSFGLLFGGAMILGAAGIAISEVLSQDGRQSATAGTTLSSMLGSNGSKTSVDTADDDVVTEAARRLQQSDETITQEKLSHYIENVKRDQNSDQNGRTGVINDPIERSESAGLAVSPERIIESKSYIKRLGDQGAEKYARSLIIADYPSRVAPGWLDKLFTNGLSVNGTELRLSYHIFPRDSDKMQQKLNVRATRLTSQIRRKKSDGKLNTIEEENQLQHVERLREGLTEGSTKLFDFGVYFEILADNEDTLNEGTQELKQILSQVNAKVTTLYDRQLQAQQSMAPLANDQIRNTQIMDLDALGTAFPFTDRSVVESTGVLMGFHMSTNAPIVVDRFEQSGHNMLISGKIGSGKSYLAKLTLWRRLMMDPETEVLIIDPVGGFSDVVEAVDGQRVTIDGRSRINPLDIKQVDNIDDVEGDPYDDKIRSVMGLFESHFQGKRELSKEEEGVLRRAIRYAYLERGITKDVSTHNQQSPVIQDVLDVLARMANGSPPSEFLNVPETVQSEITTINTETSIEDREQAERLADYAQSVLLGLEEFKKGGQRANLNGDTNVHLQDRVVQFDLSSVADGSNEGLIMHIVLDWLFQRAKANTGKMVVMIDEAHYMLGHEQALDMLNLFSRHSRHYGSGLTLISQTVDEFMTDPKAKEIYDQCDIRALMRHQDIGEEAIDALDLTPRERDFVLQAQAGNSADYSESLLSVSDAGKMRMRVMSNDFEHHVIDGDMNVWAFLYDNDLIDWGDIPDHEEQAVEQILNMNASSALS